MTDKEWQDRFQITSVKGKIWTRSEIRNRAVTMAFSLLLHKPSRELVRAEVSRVLDDEAFMRPLSGMVPSRVIEDAAFVAFHKLAPETKS